MDIIWEKNHDRREPIQNRPNFGVAIISLVLCFYLQKRLKAKIRFHRKQFFSKCRVATVHLHMHYSFFLLKSIYSLDCKTRWIRAMVKFSSSREIYNIYAICAWAYNTFTCISMNLCIQCMGSRPIPGRRWRFLEMRFEHMVLYVCNRQSNY